MAVGFRLCKQKYLPLNSDGARKAGGRWNSKGIPALYLADSIALAVLEVTVHALELPDDYVLTKVLFDDSLVQSLEIAASVPNWREDEQADTLRRIGDFWNRYRLSTVLKVPSVVVPQEFNFVINTEHPGFQNIRAVDLGPFRFDRRLRPARQTLA